MTTLTIDSGVTLRGSTGGNGGMYRIYATGSINNAGTIQFVGNAGNASSGIGGAAFTGLNCTLRGGDGGANWRLNTVNNGVAVTANTEISGGAGGAGGGDNAGHTGGASNASFAPINGSFRTLPWVTQGWYSGGPTAQPPKRITGGGGGGGGACNGAITTNSGAGGGGGGVLVLVAPTIVNSGTITVEGGAGAVAGTGVSGGSTSAAGGGGGGGGGVIFLTYHSLTNTGTLNVSGGAGGAGVTGGAAGSNGSDGSVIQTQL